MVYPQKDSAMSEQLKKDIPLADGFRAAPFVKVQQRTLPPRLWWWEIRKDGIGVPYRASAAAYRSGQEALEAGQAALSAIQKAVKRTMPA